MPLALLGVTALPFYLYVALKSVLSAMLGALATCAVLYAGLRGKKIVMETRR